MENQETLETRAVIGDGADLVKDLVDQLLSDGVVTTGVVVGGILTASDHLLWVEQGAVGTGANLINHVWLEIAVNSAWNILSLPSLREESAETLIWVGGLALLGEVSIRL